MSVSIESTFILLSSSTVLFLVSLQQNCNLVGRNSCLVELGAAGSIPVFEIYQLLFIHPFVSVCNSARLGFFVSLSPQTVPRIGLTGASDLLQSYVFNEMHALLPYVPKRLLSVRKGLSMPLQALFFCLDCTLSLSLVSNAGRKLVPIPSIPSHAHTTVILSQYLQQNNYFPLSSLLASFPLPGIGNGQSRPPLASALATGRLSSPGPLSIPAGIERSLNGATQAAPPALPQPLCPLPRLGALPSPARAAAGGTAALAARPAAETSPSPPIAAGCHGQGWAPRHRRHQRRPQLPARPRPHTGKEDAGAGGQRRRAWGWALPCGTRSLPSPPSLLPLAVSVPAAAAGSPHGAGPHPNAGREAARRWVPRAAGHGAVRGEQGRPWHGEARVCRARDCVYPETWVSPV